MATQAKTFRVFISSTFSDLVAERNALQDFVFPRLRELCARHAARFQAIDLRWGVSEEASLDQQTMNICLGEIKRCQRTTPRPNFIVLLGNRYGWCPPPPQIPANEFEALLEQVTHADSDLLLRWYKRDDNVIPPEYCLQPREMDMAFYKHWAPIERRLRTILENAVEHLGIPSEALIKYTTSATEQEIMAGAMRVPDAKEHVFCFFRDIEGLPQDHQAEGFIDLDPSQHQDMRSANKLASLKSRLEEYLQGNIYNYTASWSGEGMSREHIGYLPGDLEKCLRLLEDDDPPGTLCEAVWRSLAGVILDELSLLEDADALQVEIDAHAAFAREHSRVFVGRTKHLKRVADYLSGGKPHPLAVWGQSGCGKSALIAKAVEQAQQRDPDSVIIYRFVGTTPDSSNAKSLLEGLCHQITDLYGGDTSSIPSEYKQLEREFPKICSLASPGKPLLIFIDALDQLIDADGADRLAWLPAQLPPGVRIVVSTLSELFKQTLEKKLPYENCLLMSRMRLNQGEELLDIWLADTGRRLQSDQRKGILDSFRTSGLPLYLKLAFEQARTWKSYTTQYQLKPDIPGVIQDFFTRLSVESNHGGVLLSHALSYLAASRYGLSEDELIDLLSLDTAVMEDFLRRSPESPRVERLPIVVWSRLRFDLEPYLTERSANNISLMTFYHPSTIGRFVEKNFLSGGSKKERHLALANYFAAQPLYNDVDVKEAPNLRKLSELPFQHTRAKMWDSLERTLCDLTFIQAKCSGEMTYDLMMDYNRASQAGGILEENQARIKPFAQFVTARSHVLAQRPDLTFQEAYNLASSGPVTESGEHRLKIHDDNHIPWVRRLNRKAITGSETLQVIKSDQGRINDLKLTPDGKYLLSAGVIWDRRTGQKLRTLRGHTKSIHCVDITSNGDRIATGSGDRTVKVWDWTSGACVRTLRGHTGSVEGLAFTPDGRFLASGSSDATIKLWDLTTGACLWSREARAHRVYAVSITPDGRKVVSVGNILGLDGPARWEDVDEPGVINVWDLKNGSRLKTIEGHTEEVHALAVTPDGRKIVTGSDDKIIKVWDMFTGRCLQTLRGHQGSVNALEILPDGKSVLSAGGDFRSPAELMLWDIDSGECLKTFTGHSERILSITTTSNGSHAFTGDLEGEIRIWDLGAQAPKDEIDDHTDDILSIAAAPGAGIIITGSKDHTFKLWNIEERSCIKTIEGHGSEITGVGITSDGLKAFTAAGSSYAPLRLKMWNLEDGLCEHTWDGYSGFEGTVPVTPDGKYVLADQVSGFAALLDTDTKLRVGSPGPGLIGNRNIALVLPDGKHAVIGNKDKEIVIFTLPACQTIASFEKAEALAVTPDGETVLTATYRGDHQVWDALTAERLHNLPASKCRVQALAFLADGSHFVQQAGDRIIIRNLDSGEESACFFAEARISAIAPGPKNQVIVGDAAGQIYFLEIANLRAKQSSTARDEGPSPDNQQGQERGVQSIVLEDLRRYVDKLITESKGAKPNRVRRLLKEGSDFFDSGDFPAALECFTEALGLEPDNVKLLDKQAAAYIELGEYQPALETLDYILDRDLVSGESLGNIFIAKSRVLAGLKDYDQAIVYSHKATALLPDSHNAWYIQGWVQGEMGDYSNAINSYSRAAEFKYDLKTCLGLGYAYANLGKYAQALEEFRKFEADGPQNPLIYHGMGISLVMIKEVDLACIWLQKFVDSAGKDHEHLVDQIQLILDKLSDK